MVLCTSRRVPPKLWTIHGVVRAPEFELGEVYDVYHAIEGDELGRQRRLQLRVIGLADVTCTVRVLWMETVTPYEVPDDLTHTKKVVN